MSARQWRIARQLRRQLGAGVLSPDPEPYQQGVIDHPSKRPRWRHMWSVWRGGEVAVTLDPDFARVCRWLTAGDGIPF